MQDFTFDNHLQQNNEEFFNTLFNLQPMVENPRLELAPKSESLDRILAFNKAYSVRKMNKHQIEMLLN